MSEQEHPVDPIAVFVHDSLIEPGLINFAIRRPNATDVEVQAASTLLVLLGLCTYRLTRLTAGLDSAEVAEGGDGAQVEDLIWTPTTKDTPAAREAALAELGTQPAPKAQPEEPTPTTCRWGHFGTYL